MKYDHAILLAVDVLLPHDQIKPEDVPEIIDAFRSYLTRIEQDFKQGQKGAYQVFDSFDVQEESGE